MRETTLLFGILLGTSLVACTQADLRPKVEGDPDPEREEIATTNCPTQPFSRCDAGGVGVGAPGCTGEPGLGDGGAALIPDDAAWGVGCVVNVPATYKTPQGECLVAWACKCRDPGARDRGATQWTCAR